MCKKIGKVSLVSRSLVKSNSLEFSPQLVTEICYPWETREPVLLSFHPKEESSCL